MTAAMPSGAGRQPRVALLVHGGLEAEESGVSIPYLEQLVERIARNCDLELFTLPSRRSPKASASCDAARVHFVRTQPVRDPLLRYAFLFSSVLRTHARRRFDVIHGVWANPGGIAAVAIGHVAGTPNLVSLHGSETAELPGVGYGNLRPGPLRAATLWCCRHADALTVLSTQQIGALAARGIHRTDTVVLPPGVDTNLFRTPDESRRSDALRLLHVGNLTPVKDQTTLLRAFRLILKSLPARLRIVGGDFMQGRMHAFAAEMGVAGSVDFAGHLAHADMPAVYADADMLLQSSLHEAGGVAVAEALACGLPVCGTDTGIVHDLKGCCVAAVRTGDHEALAMEALRLWHDAGRRARLRAGGIAWTAEHSVDAAAERLLNVYRTLACGRAPAAHRPRS